MTEIYQLHEKGRKLPRNKEEKSTSEKEFEFEDKARVQADSIPALSKVMSESEMNMKRSKKKFKPRGKQVLTPSKILKLTIKIELKKQSEKLMNKKTSFSSKSKKSFRKKIKIKLSNDDHKRYLVMLYTVVVART